jgi:hypothetical protein
MCLTCKYKIQTKEEKALLFDDSRQKTYVHTADNQIIQLNDIQIDEIIESALFVLCTGVDMSCDIWAIQWPREYVVKNVFTLSPEDLEIIRYAEEALEEEFSIPDTTGQAYRKTFRPLWEKFLKKIGVNKVSNWTQEPCQICGRPVKTHDNDVCVDCLH